MTERGVVSETLALRRDRYAQGLKHPAWFGEAPRRRRERPGAEVLTKLMERDVSDFDSYADLSALGADVEGVAEFYVDRKPVVKSSAGLASDDRRANRLRTTMTHEYGHVRFHAYLMGNRAADLRHPQEQLPCKQADLQARDDP